MSSPSVSLENNSSLKPLIPLVLAVAAILTIEIVALSIWLDTASLVSNDWLTQLIADWSPAAVRFAIAFIASFFAVGWSRVTAFKFPQSAIPTRISWHLLIAHLASISLFLWISGKFFTGGPVRGSSLIAVLWLAAGFISLLFLLWAAFPPGLCLHLIRDAHGLWWRAGALASSVCAVAYLGRFLWRPTTELTFILVKLLLSPILPGMVTDSAGKIIGTAAFSVTISPQCSGLEGVALITGFGLFWLVRFRNEYRFPQALALIPAGAALLWLLNSIRIAALILIGNAGAAGIALGGFHSEAGWILFNVIAIAFSAAGTRLPWVSRRTAVDSNVPNPVLPYLGPFLAIMLGAVVSRTLTATGFEWFYPLRFFLAAAAIWYFRSAYASLDWRGGPAAVSAGLLVFGIWLCFVHFSGSAPSDIPSNLQTMSVPGRWLWLGIRVLAAITTVPIAEELAFRGFLIRQLIASDFDSLDARRYTLTAVLGSSVAFGLMHGHLWIAGIIAGLIYSAVFLRKGRIGDAVWAHAVTNACLIVWVSCTGNWNVF